MDWDFIKFIGGTIVFSGILIAAITWGASWYDEKECEVKAVGLQMSYRWQMMGGCQVLVRDRWVPLQQYRVTD
jgi:hypothetical protein